MTREPMPPEPMPRDPVTVEPTRLRVLADHNAFNPNPLHATLSALHVPFDAMLGTGACERAVDRAIRQGRRVALVGATGTGKSSVIEHVLGPLVEGLAPLNVPVALERPEIATEPAAFADHLASLIARWVRYAQPDDAGQVDAITRRRGAATQKFSVAPSWLEAKVELGYELQRAAEQPVTSATERITQAAQLLDLINADGLVPVIVLDDTDRWLATSWQPDSVRLRQGFFGRIVRLIADELGAAAAVAVHPEYLADPAYQQAQGFLEPVVTVPPIPGPQAVAAILRRRCELALPGDNTGSLVTPAAAAILYDGYARAGTGNIRRDLMLPATGALALAVDDLADVIDERHVVAALTENEPLT